MKEENELSVQVLIQTWNQQLDQSVCENLPFKTTLLNLKKYH